MDRQCRKVLDYMRTYKTITTLEAYEYCGVTRLSARVWDLRHKYGYDISSTPRKVRDRDGAYISVSAYYLEGEYGEV